MVRRLTLFACMFAALLLVAPGCDDDGGTDASTEKVLPKDQGVDTDGLVPDQSPDLPPKDCQLRVIEINGMAVDTIAQIDSTLDQDANTAGVQVDIKVSVVGAPDGTEVTLNVTDLSPAPTATSANGEATFTGVTLDPAKTPVATFTAAASNCTGFELKRNTQPDPSCTFAQPTAGVTLTKANDKIPQTPEFEYDVRVNTANAPGGNVALEVNGTPSTNSPATPNAATGVATFFSTQLSAPASKMVTLKATVTRGPLSATCEITFTLNITATPCTLNDPSPASVAIPSGRGLGPAQDKDPNTPGLQTTITVTTPGDEAELFIGGQSQGTKTTSGGTASWDVTLNNGNADIAANCRETSSGNSGSSTPARYTVDLNPPAAVSGMTCTIINRRAGTIRCSYSTPADNTDGSGLAQCKFHYRVNDDIDASNFDAADSVKRTITPAGTGVTQNVDITGLKMPNEYDFAVTCVDELGNESTLSNDTSRLQIFFATHVINGAAAGEFFGSPIAAGDFNCDGLTDIAVGSPGANGSRGEVLIYFSSGAGLPSSFSTKIVGTVANGKLGEALVSLQYDGDANKCDDLAVWASGDSGGRVYLYLGQQNFIQRNDVGDANTAGAELVYRLPGSAGGADVLGVRLVSLDFDGDGRDDLAMVSWTQQAGGSSQVVIDYGETGVALAQPNASPPQREMPTMADIVITGGTFDGLFGFGMAAGGRLAANVSHDLLVGAPRLGTGAAFVVRGAARGATLPDPPIDISTSGRVTRIDGPSDGVLFSGRLQGIGDIDGDGTPEFAIADQQYGTPVANSGRVWIFDLAGTLPASTSDAKAVVTNDFVSPAASNFLGIRMGDGAAIDAIKGADLDKDGRGDLLVGMRRAGTQLSGSIRLYFGTQTLPATLSAVQPDVILQPTGSTTSMPSSLNFVRDINGDGYPDVAVGDVGFNGNTGRIVVYY
ncbi:MAG: FG-GAP repeat protein [Myxococcales bacterium]|nr:FG-GAP repeat protein [Myxococcales bacterium]